MFKVKVGKGLKLKLGLRVELLTVRLGSAIFVAGPWAGGVLNNNRK